MNSQDDGAAIAILEDAAFAVETVLEAKLGVTRGALVLTASQLGEN